MPARAVAKTSPPPTTTTTAPPPPTTAPGPTSSGSDPTAGKSLAFNQTFGGTSLNTSTWGTCYPWFSSGTGCTNYGNSSEEEWYQSSGDVVSGGALHLVATETPTQGTNSSGAPKTYSYSSGMVTTFGSFDFTYGYVQVVAQLPGGTGTWPALWLLPQSKTWPPEIDIMENWGSANTIQTTFHYANAGVDEQAARTVTSGSSLTSGYHTYGLLWEPGSLTWYLDGNVVDTYSGSSVPSQSMYFLANLAIDGAAA